MTRDRWTVGLDPGTEYVGVCILNPKGQMHEIDVIHARGSRPFRLGCIYVTVLRRLRKLPRGKIDVAIEHALFVKSQKTAIIMGEARGALLAACGRVQARVTDYFPSQAKKAVTGKGNATKEYTATMVRRMLGLDEDPPLDAGDAGALALHHFGRRA